MRSTALSPAGCRSGPRASGSRSSPSTAYGQGPVYSYSEVVADPQVLHNGTLVSYRHPTEGEVTTPGFAIHFGKTPSEMRCGAPLAGEHSREILTELGLSDQQ